MNFDSKHFLAFIVLLFCSFFIVRFFLCVYRVHKSDNKFAAQRHCKGQK